MNLDYQGNHRNFLKILLTRNVIRYIIRRYMIKTFKCKETESIFRREYSRKLPHNIQRVALRKLRMIDRSETLNDLKIPPANVLEKLLGDRKGQYSIRINDQWRICFHWKDSNALEVEIVDYH